MYGWADNGHYRVEREPKQRSYSLDGYLDIGMKMAEGKRWNVNAEDVELMLEMRTRAQDMNVLIADVLTVTMVLKRLGDKRVYAITNNLFRVVMSLQRQRDKVYATLACFKRLKPEEYERKFISDLCSACVKRVKFIREKILPENISLTPIEEYLELAGSESLTDDIFKTVGGRQKLAELMKDGKQDDAMEAYAAHILDVVAKAGKADVYQGRIAKWYARSERIRSDREKELETEKHEAELEKAEEALGQFREALRYAVRELTGRDDAGCPKQTLEKRLAQGARGKWVLLRCETVYWKQTRRYYTEKGDWNARFLHAKLFASEREAQAVLEAEKAANPWKAYDCVKI